MPCADGSTTRDLGSATSTVLTPPKAAYFLAAPIAAPNSAPRIANMRTFSVGFGREHHGVTQSQERLPSPEHSVVPFVLFTLR